MWRFIETLTEDMRSIFRKECNNKIKIKIIKIKR